MTPAAHDTAVTDPATREALERLALSRPAFAQWVDRLAGTGGDSGFVPRSATMRALMTLGRTRLPWMRWAFSAFLMLRSLRRR